MVRMAVTIIFGQCTTTLSSLAVIMMIVLIIAIIIITINLVIMNAIARVVMLHSSCESGELVRSSAAISISSRMQTRHATLCHI